jgi:hypothetical protein
MTAQTKEPKTYQYYRCVKCQRFHTEPSPIYDEHKSHAAKSGINPIPEHSGHHHTCVDEYISRIKDAVDGILKVWREADLPCHAVTDWTNEILGSSDTEFDLRDACLRLEQIADEIGDYSELALLQVNRVQKRLLNET